MLLPFFHFAWLPDRRSFAAYTNSEIAQRTNQSKYSLLRGRFGRTQECKGCLEVMRPREQDEGVY